MKNFFLNHRKFTAAIFTAIVALFGIALISLQFGIENALSVSVGLFVLTIVLTDKQIIRGDVANDTAIPIQNAASLYTKKLIDFFYDKPTAMGFLRSLFPVETSMTEYVSVVVKRGTEKVAVDVKRYSDGNRNSFDKSTERMIKPPLYHEWLSMNEHELYKVCIEAISEGKTTYFRELVTKQAEDLMTMKDKIERSIELQCAQILDNGVVQLKNYTDIDYKRKAQSIVAYNVANDFSVATVDPAQVILAGCQFLRTVGKVQGGRIMAIVGEDALEALINNPIIQKRSDVRDYDLSKLNAPVRDSLGYAYHGYISCGSYNVDLFTYPEYYDTEQAEHIPYVDPKKVILVPPKPRFKLAFAAVPQLINNDGTIPQRGEYLMQEDFNVSKGYHRAHLKTAPIAVPVAVDQMYTVQVLS